MPSDNYVPVSVRKDIALKLKKLKETYNVDSINEVLMRMLEGEEDVFIPPNISSEEKENLEAVLEALDEIKPPSKLREVMMWFGLTLVGGTGLGIFLAMLR